MHLIAALRDARSDPEIVTRPLVGHIARALLAYCACSGAQPGVAMLPPMVPALERLGRGTTAAGPGSRAEIERAIDRLCSRVAESERPPAVSLRSGLAAWQIRRVTTYMREHLDRNIGLGELAALLKLSRSHFCTAFRRATGLTPYEWLTRERIGRARELLADRNLLITEVGLAVGYGTPSAFAAAFRRESGLTPSAFRRRLEAAEASYCIALGPLRSIGPASGSTPSRRATS